MKHRFLLFLCFAILLFALLLAACSDASPTATASITPARTSTYTPIPSTATHTLTPSATPPPTFVRTSTPTPNPLQPVAYATFGKEGFVYDSNVLYSPDGSLVALVEGGYPADSSMVRWLDTASGEDMGSIELEDASTPIAFSNNNRWLLVGGIYRTYLVDTTTSEAEEWRGGGMLSTAVYRFSADSHYISIRTGEIVPRFRWDSVEVYDLETRQVIDSYPIPSPDGNRYITNPAISPDSRWLAAGYSDGTESLLYVWNLQTTEVHLSIPHIAGINSFAFSPDGRYLASGGNDGLLRLFDTENGQLLRTVTGFVDSIKEVRFSTDGGQIIVSTSGQPDLAYNLDTGLFEPLDPPLTPEPTVDPYVAMLHQQGYTDGCGGISGPGGVMFSPDGHSLAVGEQSVQLWNLSSLSVTVSLENPYGRLLAWAFSPDGSQLAGVTNKNGVLVWDTRTGALTLTLPGYASIITGSGIGFSPDGTRLAFGVQDAVEVWDLASASLVLRIEQPTPGVKMNGLHFSADGQFLYTVINDDQSVQTWDAQNGQLIRQIDLPPVDYNAFNANALYGMRFARNNQDESGRFIELWDLETGEMIRLPTPDYQNTPILFGPDGHFILAISDNTLIFWETETGQVIYWTEIVYAVAISASLSPDGNTLAICKNGQTALWDISAVHQAALQGNYPPASGLSTLTSWGYDTPVPTLGAQSIVFPGPSTLQLGAISPANAAQLHEIAAFGRGSLSEMIWAGAPGDIRFLTAGSQGVSTFGGIPFHESAHLPTTFWSETLAQRPNGEIIAAGVNGANVQVWNLTTDQLLAELPGSGPLRLNQSGDLLIYDKLDYCSTYSCYYDTSVYDLSAEQLMATLLCDSPTLPVFSLDNRLVASTSGFSHVRIWDLQTGEIVNAVSGPDDQITDLSFSPDGQFLVGAAGGSAWVWDVDPQVTRGYELALFNREEDINGLTRYIQSVTSAQISPDNRLLAVGDNQRNIWLYEIASSTALYHLQGHAAPIEMLRFSPDGTRLLSADADGTIILWNTYNGQAVESLAAHTGPVRGLVARPDGSLRAWGENTVWNLEFTDGTLLQGTSIYSGTILAASPAGDWLAVAQRLHLSVWDAATGAFVQMLEGVPGDPWVHHFYEHRVSRGFYAASFSADGALLTAKAPGETWVYDIAAGSPFPILDYQETFSDQAALDLYDRSAVSADGFLSAIAEQYWGPVGELVLSDSSGAEIYTLTIEGMRITSLAFSPDDRLIAVGLKDGSIALVDVAAGQIIATLTGHRGMVNALAFSADGMVLVSAGEDGIIRFWSVGE